MRNYIILNGKNSNEINGLLIQELPPISKPLIRTEVEEIDGRDGDIVTPLGYSAYDKELTIGLYKNFDVNEVAAYFNSEGTVIFSNEPDKYYYYQITAQIDFERLVRYRTATVTMHCQPFKYSATEQPITEDVSGTVSDEGTNLALENTAEAPFNTLDLKGNTSQQTYSGKNQFDIDQYTNAVIRGGGSAVTVAKTNDTTLKLTNLVSQANNFVMVPLPTATRLLNGNATISFDAKLTNVTNAKVAFYWLSNSSYTDQLGDFAQVNSNGSYSVTAAVPASIPSGSTRLAVALYSAGSAQPVNSTVEFSNIQVEVGSTPTTWEKFVGGTASPNPDYPQAVQVVTGENTVKIHGKNLLKYPYKDTTVTRNGVTFTDNGDGTITANGTATADSLFWLTNDTWAYSANNVIIPAGTYTISKTGQSYATMYVTAYGKTQGQIGTFSVSTSDATFTTTEETSLTVRLKINSGTTVSGFVFCPQIEKGAATDYEPYQEQIYEVNLGKNLLDSSWESGQYDTSTGEKNSVSGYRTASMVAVQPNTKYIVSRGGQGVAMNILAYKGDGTFLSYLGTPSAGTSFTTPTGCYYITMYRGTSGGIDNMMLEKGSKITTYAPYFTPIELCKIGTYQDYIWKDGDTWKVHSECGKAVLDGSEDWISSTTQGYAYMRGLLDSFAKIGEPLLYCDQFTRRTGGHGEYEYIWLLVAEGDLYLQISDSRLSGHTLAAFKTWLSQNKPVVYYALATPTDTEITNEALIAQLDDIYYHAHAYKGRTHITSSAATGNVPHIIAAEVGEDNESTITNAGNYLSKPKITVYGSGDISLYINDMHALQITLGDEGYITIDTAQMEAYKDTLDNLKNRLVIGDYSNARLKPGANKIHFTGTVTKYVVENYSRWL